MRNDVMCNTYVHAKSCGNKALLTSKKTFAFEALELHIYRSMTSAFCICMFYSFHFSLSACMPVLQPSLSPTHLVDYNLIYHLIFLESSEMFRSLFMMSNNIWVNGRMHL